MARMHFEIPEFTDADWDRISAAQGSDARLVEVWRVTMAKVGQDFDAEPGPIRPTQYQILEADWHRACKAVMDGKDTDLGRSNAGLDFVNVGPSHRKVNA